MYLKAIALVIVLMSGIGVQAGAAHGDNGSVVFGNAPFLNVTLPHNLSYNLTYLGLVYVPGAPSSQPSANYFSRDNWSNSFNNNGSMSYHSTFQIRPTGIGMMGENEHAQQFNGYLLNNSIYPALFWWNNTYNLNGNNEALISSYGSMFPDMFESGQVNFEFNLSGSNSVIFQDPYLATAGIGITTLPPSTITLAAINFLLEHAELLAGGAAIGSVLIAIPYFAYRRKKLV